MESHAASLIAKKRYDEAQSLLYTLSGQGSVYSLLALGWMHESGAIEPKDTKIAKSYYERAALEGDSEAYLRLGRLLMNEGERPQARAAFEAGAEMGNLGSMYELGIALLEGAGGTASDERAIAWLKRAAEEGHIFSERKLISIEATQSRSLIERILLIPRILVLATKAFKVGFRDVYSDKLS
ncbi:MAG: tetratricopeptide repeat protein [Pseudomonadota bacterium]